VGIMSKPSRNAIAVILRNKQDPKQFLAVQRPTTDEDLGGFWGLPATRMRDNELPEDAARRVCREKLGCEAVPLRLVGTMFQKRNSYDLFFMDVEMLLTGESEPDITKATTDSTIYVDQKWTDDTSLLLPAAKSGSCCTTLFLTDQGAFDHDDWVLSLEDSASVS
jgi:ADP-ribose pyrophosphatase YjhB (NUDIX family)